MRKYAVFLALILASCESGSSGVKVIVGAKLIAAPGRTPVDYSVVVIQDGKILAAGPQASTPVPKGSEITRGTGMTIEPESGGDSIEPGHPANLVLKGSSTRTMHNGAWVN